MGFSEYWNNHLAIQVESNKPLTELSCWDMPQPTLKNENNIEIESMFIVLEVWGLTIEVTECRPKINICVIWMLST